MYANDAHKRRFYCSNTKKCSYIGLSLNIVKTYNMEISHRRTMVASERVSIACYSYEKLKYLQYLGSQYTNQSCVLKEIISTFQIVHLSYSSLLVLSLLNYRTKN